MWNFGQGAYQDTTQKKSSPPEPPRDDPRQLSPDDEPFQAAKAFHTQRHLTDAEQSDLVAKYQAGSNMVQLARHFGIHRRTVREILSRHEVDVRQRVLTTTQIDEAIRLYRHGMSLAAVGRRFGVEHSTIRKHLIARGIRRRNTHGREVENVPFA